MRRLIIAIVFAALAITVSGFPSSPLAQAQSCFPNGFCIQNAAFLEYYTSRGQERTLGFPISNEFTLEGFRVQLFQRVVLQLNQGAVARLNLLDANVMPLTRANASVFPPTDDALASSAPQIGSPTYARDVVEFVRRASPNEVGGQPVRFFDTFTTTVPAQPGANPDIMALLNLEIWGLPTSRPVADPGNGGFIYQRFQRGIMHFDAGCGCTQGILIGEYFKALITGASLPADLDADMQGSRFYRQYAPDAPDGVARPDQLPNTNLKGAFGDLQAPPPVTGTRPTPAATPGVSTLPSDAPERLTNTTWLWQRTEYANDTVLAAPDPRLYAVTFQRDGDLRILADCNRVTGTYTLDESRLSLSPGAATLALCPAGSQDQAFLRDLRNVAAYVFDGENLVLNLRVDGGNMVFAPRPAHSLIGPEWRVVGVNNGRGGLASVLPDVPLTVTFGEDGRVTGNSGCNLFQGGYTLTGSSLSVGELISTRRACISDALNAQEQQFLTALRAAATYGLEGEDMTLRDAAGAMQLVLAAGS